jgi:hypothetical protein
MPRRLAFMLLAALLSTRADALLFRAYVASDGNDANPCTLPAPCRLLPAALTAVADGGEIWMLDSANYNTSSVSILKSVTILAVPGAVGSVVANGGTAISVTSPGLTITLRNIVVVPIPASGASFGIYLIAGSTVIVEDSHISLMPSGAIYAFGSGAHVKVLGSTISGTVSGYALELANGASADVQGSRLVRNSYGGIYAYSVTTASTGATLSDSFISSGIEGVFAYASGTGAAASIVVSRSTIQRTDFGVDSEAEAAGVATISVSNSTITNNGKGYYQAGAGSDIRSLRNNHISDNASNTGVLTTELQQ